MYMTCIHECFPSIDGCTFDTAGFCGHPCLSPTAHVVTYVGENVKIQSIGTVKIKIHN